MGSEPRMASWEEAGLTAKEYDEICEQLRRPPNALELGMYGLMWSEHCSYKSSLLHLEQLPTEGERVLQGPGENAGIIDLGDGLAAAFRIESHNHPSAVEPVQGAATGVGGILRDILAVGARPIALLDSLRFGNLHDSRVEHLFSGVVSGISQYGNSVGVPTVGGEVYFDDAYADNPLVNVMCVGIMSTEQLTRGTAVGPGNPVYIVGAPTGRDGIHGASLLASRQLGDGDGDMRPAVQVGDPFREKLLIEGCLEMLQSDAVIGLNDLGAAGLTSAASETAARGGTGMDIDIRAVPRRESDMTPYEIMLSESQERMLVIGRRGCEEEIEETFRRWELDAACIGKVTNDEVLSIRDGERILAHIPVQSLTSGAPRYDRPTRPPSDCAAREAGAEEIPIPHDAGDALLQMLSHPNLCSRRSIYRQYDHMVGIDTVLTPGADAAVLRIKGTERGLALVTDGNGMLCRLDPERGAAQTVAESYRNICAVGGEPLAVTNCLNFADPEHPEVMHAFQQVVQGMARACRELNTPVTGGNVSFYNQTLDRGIAPTPVIGMVGSVDDVSRCPGRGFQRPGDAVLMAGQINTAKLAASQYLNIMHGLQEGPVPEVDYDAERRAGELCRRAIMEDAVHSATDISDGGLMIAVSECGAASDEGLGCRLDLTDSRRPDELLFGEGGPRYLLTVPEDQIDTLVCLARETQCPVERIGTVGGSEVQVHVNGELILRASVPSLCRARGEGLT